MQRRKKEAGFAVLLLELLVGMLVFSILMGATVANTINVRKIHNQSLARNRVWTIAYAKTEVAICGMTTGCVPTQSVLALSGPPATVNQEGYTFLSANSGGNWSYTAVPLAAGFSGAISYYIDQQLIMHCANVGTATSASAVCQ